ncbi:hypothetical protein BEH75_24625 [Citrobacter freundii]|nr:hypothetical protein BEH75_24625 [Citrobacter freundii]
MAKFTKELAKLFRKITNSEIDAEGNAHVVLSPADSLLINNARIALASLEAEAVACIDRANLDYLESGADADVWPASGAGSDDVLLYAAPQLPQPAVLSVPDEIPKLKDGMGFKYVKDGVRYSLNYANGWNACRAAMLQLYGNSEQLDEVGSWNNHRNTPTAQAGNSPVIPDGWQLVPKEPTAVMNKAGWDAMNEHDAINPTYRAMLAAAPQQEVKS